MGTGKPGITTCPRREAVHRFEAELAKARMQRITRLWWARYRPNCTIFVSDLVFADVTAGKMQRGNEYELRTLSAHMELQASREPYNSPPGDTKGRIARLSLSCNLHTRSDDEPAQMRDPLTEDLAAIRRFRTRRLEQLLRDLDKGRLKSRLARNTSGSRSDGASSGEPPRGLGPTRPER